MESQNLPDPLPCPSSQLILIGLVALQALLLEMSKKLGLYTS